MICFSVMCMLLVTILFVIVAAIKFFLLGCIWSGIFLLVVVPILFTLGVFIVEDMRE